MHVTDGLVERNKFRAKVLAAGLDTFWASGMEISGSTGDGN
jgi:hypothetical protein